MIAIVILVFAEDSMISAKAYSYKLMLYPGDPADIAQSFGFCQRVFKGSHHGRDLSSIESRS